MANLPGTVHFIAEAPGFDPVRLLVTMTDTHIAPVAAGRMIGIFHNLPRVIDALCPQIDGPHDIGAGCF
ncbi:hypothetical protein D3C75_1295540 [compost metagenome]